MNKGYNWELKMLNKALILIVFLLRKSREDYDGNMLHKETYKKRSWFNTNNLELLN